MYDVLLEEGVIVEGHFVLRSGRHADRYINKTKIFDNAFLIFNIAYELGSKFVKASNPEVIAGPESGGGILAKAVKNEMHGVSHWIEIAKGDGEYEFTVRNEVIPVIAGKRVAVVDDVVTTGGSLKGAVKAVQDVGGVVVGVYAIIKRGVECPDLGDGFPFACLSAFDLPDYDADDCPLCDRGFPTTPKPQ